MDNPGYYANIPANVRYDKELSANAKLLYGELTALSNKEGYCWAGNQYFASLYGVTKVTVSTWIGQLKERGYIDVQMQYKEGSKQILNRYIRISGEGIKENLNTSQRKPYDPIKENLKDNNTINNTSNITVINYLVDSRWNELSFCIWGTCFPLINCNIRCIINCIIIFKVFFNRVIRFSL